MATVIAAILLTLAYIKAGSARITAACMAKIGDDANYDHESKAFVLTTIEPNGKSTWTGKNCGTADTVVRVYAACKSETEWLVYIGAKWRGGRADRGIGGAVQLASAEAAEKLITLTVWQLSQGDYTGPLTSRLPRAFHGMKCCERFDQVRAARKASNVVTTVTDDAMAAVDAALAAAEAADKPADKPKAPEAPKATK